MKKIKIIIFVLAVVIAGHVYADTTLPLAGAEESQAIAVDGSKIKAYSDLYPSYENQYIKSVTFTITDVADGKLTIKASFMGNYWLNCVDLPFSEIGSVTFNLSNQNCSTYEPISSDNNGDIVASGSFFGGPSTIGTDDGVNGPQIYGSMVVGCIGSCTPELPADTSLSGLISNASNGVQTVSGSSIGSVVSWTADNLIKLFVGSGLMILIALRYWIIALIVIAIIIYFAYRAYKFYRA